MSSLGKAFLGKASQSTARQRFIASGAQFAVAANIYNLLDKLVEEPDALIVMGGVSPIPLGFSFHGLESSVQYYEVARSQDLLHYRSLGAAFMAQQQGAHTGVRIDLTLSGEWSGVYLSLLQFVYIWGRGAIREVDESNKKGWDKDLSLDETIVEAKREAQIAVGSSKSSLGLRNNPGAPKKNFLSSNFPGFLAGNLSTILPRMYKRLFGSSVKTVKLQNIPSGNKRAAKIGKLYKVEHVDSTTYKDINTLKTDLRDDMLEKGNKIVPTDDESWSKSEWHNTFTLISKTDVLFDMYIETMGYRRIVEEGKNVIKVNLLLRHFDPPREVVKTYNKLVKKNHPGTNIASGGYDKVKVVEYAPETGSLNAKFRTIELTTVRWIMNAIWRQAWVFKKYGMRLNSTYTLTKEEQKKGVPPYVVDDSKFKINNLGDFDTGVDRIGELDVIV